jgi:predicted  nucleic acid-binding Zn-ribbon protein
MSRAQLLYQLQELDNEEEAIRKRLAEIEVALGETATQRRAKKAVEKTNKLARQWSVKQQDLELQVSTLKKKIADSEHRLYSGNIRNPKELSDRQAELASLKRRLEAKEEDLLETMIEREEAEIMAKKAQARLRRVNQELELSQQSLLAERKEIKTRSEAVSEQRANLSAAIPADDLRLYQHLRSAKGNAVAIVSGETCTGCWIQLFPNHLARVRRGDLTFCDNCERILLLGE